MSVLDDAIDLAVDQARLESLLAPGQLATLDRMRGHLHGRTVITRVLPSGAAHLVQGDQLWTLTPAGAVLERGARA